MGDQGAEPLCDVKRELQRFRNELAEVGIEVTVEALARVLFDLPEEGTGRCIVCGELCIVPLCWTCFLKRLTGEPDPRVN